MEAVRGGVWIFSGIAHYLPVCVHNRLKSNATTTDALGCVLLTTKLRINLG